MPSTIHARVVLEGRRPDPGAGVGADVTCVRALLDDIFAMHNATFQIAFGGVDVSGLLADWRNNGLQSRHVPMWVEMLRKAAFEAENLGEASVELRDMDDPEAAPGVIPVFCAILDHLAGCCGLDGAVILVFPEDE